MLWPYVDVMEILIFLSHLPVMLIGLKYAEKLKKQGAISLRTNLTSSQGYFIPS
jgi:hypothetical protein